MNKTRRYTQEERNDIINRLNEDPAKFCTYFFPNGVLENGTWRIGGIDGHAGHSLGITVVGDKIGWWKDFGEPEEKGGTNFIDLLAKHRKIPFNKALAEAKAWLDAGDTAKPLPIATLSSATKPKPTRGRAKKEEKPFDWETCLRKTEPRGLTRLCDERKYSTGFMSWLHHSEKLIACYDGEIAFPVHNEAGVVVGIHVKDAKAGSWRYMGGCSARPFIIGDLPNAKIVYVFESQWDCFSVYDTANLTVEGGVAALITRGASNGKFVEGRIPKDAKVYAFKQNDPLDQNGRAAADEWLASVTRHAGVAVHLVSTPAPHKDACDWVKDGGATKKQIEAAMQNATLVPASEQQPSKNPSQHQPTAPAATEAKELPDCYYEPSQRRGWFMPDSTGGYVEVNDGSLKRFLKSQGYSPDIPEDAFLSPLDDVTMRLQQHHYLVYAGPLAGYFCGIHKVQGANVLVTTSPVFIKPQPGEWPVFGALLEGMLVDGQVDQRRYLFGWIKVAVEALQKNIRRPGQAMVLAGPADCGKSLVQNLITIIFGGRSAKPYHFMTGSTPFNRDLFTAEHLMVEDEVPSADYRSRRNFGTNIKGVTVNATQRLHQKFRDAIILEPFWRLTISLNDETENLQVLPPIDESIGDKLMLLKVVKKPMPMPANTDEQRTRFWETLIKELPCFLHWLSKWEIPQELRSERYGVRHFHHSEIVQAVDELAPEARLLGLIDDELFGFGPGTAPPWTGTARQLEKKLLEPSLVSVQEVRRLLSFNTACGTYLARLEQRHPHRMSSRTVKGYRIWTIQPPEDCPDLGDDATGDNVNAPAQD